jgi:hypothetical protein
MNVSWKCEKGQLVSRWSDAGKYPPYDAPWMHNTTNVNPRDPAPAYSDFTRLSPFGGLTARIVLMQTKQRDRGCSR